MTGAEITPLHQFSQYDQWFATIRGLRRVRFETPIQPFSGKFGGNLEQVARQDGRLIPAFASSVRSVG